MGNSAKPGLSAARIACVGGICSALAAIFQLAPLALPVAGLAISPLSTAPVAFSAVFSPVAGVASFICAGTLIAALSLQEAMIFVFGTGLLGLACGLTLRRNIHIASLISAAALYGGLMAMLLGFGFSFLGPLTSGASAAVIILCAPSAAAYSYLWQLVLRYFYRRLPKTFS